MIHRDRRIPQVGRVTVFTDIGRADMLETLAGGRDAIVTGATGFGRRGMIEACR